MEIGFFLCFFDGISYSRIFFHDKSNGDIHFLLRRRSFKLHLRLKSEKGVKNVNKPIFWGENRNSCFWAALMGFFTYSRIFFHEKSNGDIHFFISETFYQTSPKVKVRKRGIFAVFWVKIQNQLSGHISLDFFISSEKNNYHRTPCKISALMDKRF